MRTSTGMRFTVVAALVTGVAIGLPPVAANAATSTATLIRSVNIGGQADGWAVPSSDPAGITYDVARQRLVISDSEVDEIPAYAGYNVFFSSLAGVQNAANPGWTTLPWSVEAAGVSYANPSLALVSDDDADKIFLVPTGSDGRPTSTNTPPSFSTRPFSGDPEDITIDADFANNGHILIVDGVNTDVYDYSPGPNGRYEGISASTDDVLVTFDVGQYGAIDCEGVTYDPVRNSILVLDGGSKSVYELDRQGRLLNVVDISAVGARKAAGITLAPASNGSGATNAYIVDRNYDNDTVPDENDGRFFEVALNLPPVGPNRAPVVSAGPDVSVISPNSASLVGSVSDDGLPASPGRTSVAWTTVSGPGTVTFGSPSATSTTASFSAAGSYVLRLTATDGLLSTRDEVTVSVSPAGVLDIPVRAGSDDAEQRSGSTDLVGSDLELTTDGSTVQTVGLRFTGVGVPKGATITNAYVQFQVDETGSAATSLTVAGQAADNAPTFTTAKNDVSARPRTAATVGWAPPAWNTVNARGVDQRTPNLAPVLQQIVSRSGWVNGNALALVVTGTGTRTAEAFEGTAAPVLHVEFSGGSGTPAPVNNAPTVNAGPDRSVVQPNAATLSGTVTDDGRPTPVNLTQTWSKVSGPGTVTFAQPNAASTTATFSQPGTYVLQLTATDGEKSANDQVSVTVSAAAAQNQPPTVSAGPDRSVTLPGSATLSGSVTDDGQPAPANLTQTWSKVSGPGTVTFAQPNAASTTATFSDAGTYVLRLTGSDGALSAFDETTVTVAAGTPPSGGTVSLDVPIRASVDDAEERTSNRTPVTTSGDLNLGLDEGRAHVVGMRFSGVTVPAGATITNAYVQFQVDEVGTAATSLTINGEAADNALSFSTATSNVSSRPTTAASVAWTPASWPTANARGVDQRTPNLAAVLQQIVSRGGWASGNAVSLFVTGTGTRIAESYDGGAAKAPVLHIEYTR